MMSLSMMRGHFLEPGRLRRETLEEEKHEGCEDLSLMIVGSLYPSRVASSCGQLCTVARTSVCIEKLCLLTNSSRGEHHRQQMTQIHSLETSGWRLPRGCRFSTRLVVKLVCLGPSWCDHQGPHRLGSWEPSRCAARGFDFTSQSPTKTICLPLSLYIGMSIHRVSIVQWPQTGTLLLNRGGPEAIYPAVPYARPWPIATDSGQLQRDGFRHSGLFVSRRARSSLRAEPAFPSSVPRGGPL